MRPGGGVCESPAMRRGADYLASLRDGRAVFLDGERVDDVTRHPAFAESTRRIADWRPRTAATQCQRLILYPLPSPEFCC